MCLFTCLDLSVSAGHTGDSAECPVQTAGQMTVYVTPLGATWTVCVCVCETDKSQLPFGIHGESEKKAVEKNGLRERKKCQKIYQHLTKHG